MKVAVFSTKPYDTRFLADEAARSGHTLTFFEARLDETTASLADGFDAVCVFVNDTLNAATIGRLKGHGVQAIALRCAGFNNVDLQEAADKAITVVRVPAYSPFAVAEHAIALILALNRKIHRAHNRVREGNFALDGLMGFDLHGRTIGVVGTGHIGMVFCRIAKGFTDTILACDVVQHTAAADIGVQYVSLNELYARSDIISLHCPLTPDTFHMIGDSSIARMKDGVMLINTSRGALVNTAALITGLKSGKIGSVGLDVYEEEADLFFEDLSNTVLTDDIFARLLTFPNVLITGHQAFFTAQALANIASVTFANLTSLEKGDACPNVVTQQKVR